MTFGTASIDRRYPARVLFSFILCVACASQPQPDVQCEALWGSEVAREFVDLLASVTGDPRSVWGEFGLADGAYLLDAGESETGGSCLGLWQDGRSVAYATVDQKPKLLTPLYGYYFSSSTVGDSQPPLIAAATQPPAVREWLAEQEVDRAVILPVEVRDFPIEMTALRKVQLGIHEAFHIGVQMPRWYDATGPWPTWDLQPDRAGLHACYAATPEVETALQEERRSLVQMINSLLDDDGTGACSAGYDFLTKRAARYELLSDVTVARHDSTAGSCREAEAIMELEEGTADYASWTVLFDVGVATRDQLIRRYQAQQSDLYYLTGAMQLHAMQLMRPGGMADLTRVIAESAGPQEGSLTSLFGATLDASCR